MAKEDMFDPNRLRELWKPVEKPDEPEQLELPQAGPLQLYEDLRHLVESELPQSWIAFEIMFDQVKELLDKQFPDLDQPGLDEAGLEENQAELAKVLNQIEDFLEANTLV